MSDTEEELNKIQDELDKVESDIQRLNCRRNELLEKKASIKDTRRLNRRKQLETRDWSGENFSWSKPLRRALRDVFGLSEFRPKQLETINAIMHHHDVLLLAPTGGGKSLCFQLPASISDGLTLVVSPLLSLMEDQVWSLKRHRVPAEILCSTTDKDRANSILKQLTGSEECNIKLLYVTPERIAKSKRFMTALQKLYQAKKLDRFAIDEVHCVSQWGHDFRPDFKFLSNLKNMFPDVPILGVTATATAKVLIDVQKILNIRDCVVFNAPFNRKNLYYHVMEKPSDKSEVCDLLADLLLDRYVNKSGIIYTFSIKDAEDLANELLKRDVKVRPYHANLDAPERTKVHSKWLKNDIQAVVATVAFGMGIDKSNCRFVIHHTISKSMENFYQESGRAGRDGENAECVVLYRFQDISKITTMMFTEYTGLKNAYSMISFCINGSQCRRELLSKHFSEVWDGVSCNRMCDRCYYDDKIPAKKIHLAKHLNTLCQLIDHAENQDVKLTGLKLIDAWYHKGPNKLRMDNSFAPDFDRYYGEQIVAYCLIHNYLKEDFHFTAYSANSYIKRGQNSIKHGSDVEFQPARVLRLPTKSFVQENEDVMFVKESRVVKKRQSESNYVSPTKRPSSTKKERKESTVVLTSDDDSGIKRSSEDARICETPSYRTSRREWTKIGSLDAQVIVENKRRSRNETVTSSSHQLSEDELVEIRNPLVTIEID